MYDEMSHFYTGIILTIKLNDSYIHNLTEYYKMFLSTKTMMEHPRISC